MNSRDNRWTVGGRPAVAFPSESSRYQLIVGTVELSEAERERERERQQSK